MLWTTASTLLRTTMCAGALRATLLRATMCAGALRATLLRTVLGAAGISVTASALSHFHVLFDALGDGFADIISRGALRAARGG